MDGRQGRRGQRVARRLEGVILAEIVRAPTNNRLRVIPQVTVTGHDHYIIYRSPASFPHKSGQSQGDQKAAA